ncbi:double-strand break repair protein AddB [Mangrovicella endophytica]|uniref:double-strand break repair protein AddB n=1 Tax=Mangrovicella endophytica TaxID=2066697 RepID=UPI000C9DB0B8|nr:double-strand break repair protein AddB [Mangrovicella endophytica]
MRANVLSIPPGQPFLPTLAAGLIDGRVVPGFTATGDPLALAGATIYVPTRRAARELGAAFTALLGGKAAILPRILPLGENDEVGLFAAAGAGAALLPVMDDLERRLSLARLVREWRSRTREAEIAALVGGEIVLPASSADALWLARDLAVLLDEAETEGTDFRALAQLAPERLASWWQLTLTFLSIVTEHWPQALAARGLASEVGARNAWLVAEAERYRQIGSTGPVVIAGSTATAPATLTLMRAVANLPLGAVVMPGLDRDLSEPDFGAVDAARSLASAGHSQFGLKRILAGLLLPREAVTPLVADTGENGALRAREALVSDALRPAETSDAWAAVRRHGSEATTGLALIEAADEAAEALAVACAMRDALTDPSATVALTTPDRNLARRVVVELKRFGIEANDSAGRPLSATAPGALLALCIDVALSPGDPVALISLLKHPLTRLGLTAADARRAARTLEMIALRGQVGIADAASLSQLYATARAASEAEGARLARPVTLILPEERDLAATMAERLETALSPLTRLRDGAPAEIAAFAQAVTQSLEALAADPDGDAAHLYATETGAALAAFLSELVQAPACGFAFEPAELGDVCAALMADQTVRPRGGLSARAFVWGALEARLQSVDTMILGGLNEGTWPAGARSDAFLSRLMRAELALDPPERRIGLAAHDIWMALGTKRVVLARAARTGGAPAVPSRWLQRLLAVAGPEAAERMRREGTVYLDAARGLDTAEDAPRIGRPEPRPPLAARPRNYSITEVETLIRDPYAVHARRILKLDPLPELIRAPHAAERGTLFHDILADFVMEGIDPTASDAEERLLAIAARRFAEAALPADVAAIWWPRMQTLATNVVAWERGRAGAVARRDAELSGRAVFDDIETVLAGRADRIDLMADGSVEIIDFKTGTSPSLSQARTLLAPQLPLEGAMTRLGAFPGFAEGTRVADLLYVRLREREFYDERLSHIDKATGEPVTAEDLSDSALERFRTLAAAFRNPAHPFTSRTRPFLAGDFSGPYDHLARAREWSIGADGDTALAEGEA